MTVDGACAWLGPQRHAVLWPARYRVRFDPVELIGPHGQIVAKEGQQLRFAGDALPATERRSRCGNPNDVIALTSLPKFGAAN